MESVIKKWNRQSTCDQYERWLNQYELHKQYTSSIMEIQTICRRKQKSRVYELA